MRKKQKSKRKGSAMPLVMFAIVLLLLMGLGILGLGLRSRFFAVKRSSEIAAYCAADAGLVKALTEMNQKLEVKPWSDSDLPYAQDENLENCNATYSYEVRSDGFDYFIESIGNSGEATKKVRCTLGLEGPFEYAIFANNQISLKSGTTIDGYNLSPDERLKIGVNSILEGKIIARFGVTIDGDAVVGAGGDPEHVIVSRNEAIITGETSALTLPHPLPEVTVPQYLLDLPSVGDITESTTISDDIRCDKVDLDPYHILTIDGPVTIYCSDYFTLRNYSQLKIVGESINPDASLELYLGGDFRTLQDTHVNAETKDPKKLKIYGLNESLSFSFLGNETFYGGVYAPNANVTFLNSADVYGAIICRQFAQQVSSDFHYDASLQDVSIDDSYVRFVVKQWQEE
jgi:hypothetical protein